MKILYPNANNTLGIANPDFRTVAPIEYFLPVVEHYNRYENIKSSSKKQNPISPSLTLHVIETITQSKH